MPVLRPVLIALPMLFGLTAPLFAHAGHAGDDHPMVEVSAQSAPQILSARVENHPRGGIDIHIDVAGFRFAPPVTDAEGAAAGDDPQRGMVMVYINGSKLARMETPHLHLPELPFGPHDIRLVLVTRGQAEIAVRGKPVEARLEFTVE